MKVLIDTGILLRLLDPHDPHYVSIVASLDRLHTLPHDLVVAPQNLVEFWSVSTRPASSRGGYGIGPEQAAARLEILEFAFHVLAESESIHAIWKSLVRTTQTIGRQVHDARIAAIMQWHQIPFVMTLNVSDFQRYQQLHAYEPTQIPDSLISTIK